MKSHTVIRFPTSAKLGEAERLLIQRRKGPMASRPGWFKRLLRRFM